MTPLHAELKSVTQQLMSLSFNQKRVRVMEGDESEELDDVPAPGQTEEEIVLDRTILSASTAVIMLTYGVVDTLEALDAHDIQLD